MSIPFWPMTVAGRISPSGDDGEHPIIAVAGDKRTIFCPDMTLQNVVGYTFDYAFDDRASTSNIFDECVLPLAGEVLHGRNAVCIVAGEDATAKLMTAEGRPEFELPGFYNLAASALFRGVSMRRDSRTVKSVIRLTWYYIENDVIRDALAAAGNVQSKDLRMRDDPEVGVVVPGLWEVEVTSTDDVAQVIRNVRAKTPAVASNHSVMSLALEEEVVPRPESGRDAFRSARLSIITLATAAGAGPDGMEVPNWVKSLHHVMGAFEEKAPSIPFHTSRIALGLRDALSGKHRSAMVVVVSSAIQDSTASAAALKFAQRVRRIANPMASADSKVPSQTNGSPSRSPHAPRGGASFNMTRFSELASAPTGASPGGKHRSGVMTEHHPVREEEGGGDRQGERGGISSSHVLSRVVNMVHDSSAPASAASSSTGDHRVPQNSAVSSRVHHTLSSVSPPPNLAAADDHNPLHRAEAMAQRMMGLANDGDESASWFVALFHALETTREQNRQLRNRLDTVLQQGGGARSTDASPGAGVTQGRSTSNRQASLVSRLQADLRATRQEVKDYEVYKEVMESAMVRIQKEAGKTLDEKAKLTKQVNQLQRALRKEREQQTLAKAEVSKLYEEVDRLQTALRGAKQDAASAAAATESAAADHMQRQQEQHNQFSAELKSRIHQLEEELARIHQGAGDSGRESTAHADPHRPYDQQNRDELLEQAASVADDVLRAVSAQPSAQHPGKSVPSYSNEGVGTTTTPRVKGFQALAAGLERDMLAGRRRNTTRRGSR